MSYEIAFVNCPAEQCGVYDFGLRLFKILNTKLDVYYIETKENVSFEHFRNVIYNYHPVYTKYLDENFKSQSNVLICSHDIHYNIPNAKIIDFDITEKHKGNNVFYSPRPVLVKEIGQEKINDKLTIGSFGLGYYVKNYQFLIEQIKDYDCVLRMHFPSATFVGPTNIGKVLDLVRPHPNIELKLYSQYLNQDCLLEWLSENDINVFTYGQSSSNGVSSSIDYALSVKKPIAVNRNPMFRHLFDVNPSIFVEDNSVLNIKNYGISPLQKVYETHSNENLIRFFQKLLI